MRCTNLSGTKSGKLIEELRYIIQNGDYKAEDRFYSQSELCSMFGVSNITVRDAIGTLVAEGYLHREQGRGTFIAKKDADAAPGKMLGVVLRSDAEVGYLGPFYSDVFDGMYTRLAECGYGLQIFTSKSDGDGASFDQEILKTNVKGMLLLGQMPDELVKSISDILPTVIVDHHTDDERLDAVVTDNINGAIMAINHLVDLGHRRIGFIDGWYYTSSVHERLMGYKEALQSHGLEFDPQLVIAGNNRFDTGYTAMKRFLAMDQPPTAVFAQNDPAALSAIEAIREAGLSIPDDISIIGFDDIAEAAESRVPMTTIRVHRRNMGICAVDKLALAISSGVPAGKQVMPVELIVRNSTGPCSK